MLVAEYIAQFIKSKGTSHAFGYPGGMVTYLMDAFDDLPDFYAYSLYHEQSASFAASAYAQRNNKVGVAYATSGPGATNLVTGIAHAFYESVPVLFITGQVNTNEAKGNLLIRQKGFQETDVISIVKSITKYSTYISSANDIRYELEKAYFEATSGRPGPVLLDIPINIQRTEINPIDLKSYVEPSLVSKDYQSEIDTLNDCLRKSKKPILLLGNGVNVSNSRELINKVIDKLQIPVVTSMIAVDVIEYNHPLNFSFIGAYGTRYSNLILSQSDLIITMGSRLDIRQTGSNTKEFAKNATILRLDIDENEFSNMINSNTINLKVSLHYFLKSLLDSETLVSHNHYSWLKQCYFYKSKLDHIDDLLPNKIVSKISESIPDDSTITTDVGQNQVWISQSFQVKKHQRVLYSGGHGSMGYSLPAAIGAHYATGQNIYCFTGDGGLQINIQELQFIYRERLPIKIIVLNNNSLGMIRHFQEMYFNSNFAQTVENKGYSAPDFTEIARAYKIRAKSISNIEEIIEINEWLKDSEPCLINIFVGNTTFVFPKLEFTKPIYDQEPPLDRELLKELLDYEDK